MDKKYELLEDDTIEIGERILYRIKALRSFGDVKCASLGGYIEKESNLSHDNNCWVYKKAKVYGNARIFDNAEIFGNSEVFGEAKISGNARIYGDAKVYGNARVFGNNGVFGEAKVYGNADVFGNSEVFGEAKIFGDANVSGEAKIYTGNISKASDYITIGPIGSRNDYTTFFLDNDIIKVSCGCFKGTLDEFELKVKETHKDNIHAKKYLIVIESIKQLLI